MAKMQIKRIGVFSLAKVYGILMAAIALIIGIPLGFIMMVIGAATMSSRNGFGGGMGIGLGLFYMILFPIVYGVIGFVFGALSALVYNVAAGFVGGLEWEFEPVNTEYAAPPPPQWNAGQQQQPGPQQYPY